MCDDQTERDNDTYLSRRELGRLGAGATLGLGMAAMLPATANAVSVTGRTINVPTQDGSADCYFVHPTVGLHPGVVIWPDIIGLRPAFELMGKRLAESGYAVLVVNPYYRQVPAPVLTAGASFSDPDTRAQLLPLARGLSFETNTRDAQSFVQFLDSQSVVDTKRKIGTTGYCMGGPITFRTVAAVPGRIGAAASFHGGRLVTDEPNSPHRLAAKSDASYLIAIAENDDAKEPKTKDVLRKTFADAGVEAEIEVYTGAMHGWCPPDSRVYHQAQAERAWTRLLALFEQALA